MKKGLSRLHWISISLFLLWAVVACRPNPDALQRSSQTDAIETTFPAPVVNVLPTKTPSLMPSPSLIMPTEILVETKAETPLTEGPLTETVDSTQSPEKNQGFTYPESHYIRGIAGHSQHYYLSCESSAAVDWAWFFGVNIYESTFQADMPRSDNPDYGYVGDFTTRIWGQIPPYSYGVHAEPIADGLRTYDLPAKAVKNYSLDEVKQMLSEDKPIIAWIIGNLEYSEPVEYVDKEGRVAIVAPFEHVVILTGYDEDSIRYMNNGKFYDAPTEVFLTSWGVLGNMAVVYDEQIEP